MHCNTLQIDSTKARHNRRLTRRLWCVCTRHNIIYYYFILIIIITISLSYNRLVRVAFDTSIPSPRVPAVCRPLSPRGRGSVAGFRTPKRPEDTLYNIQVLIILRYTLAHTLRFVYFTCAIHWNLP